MPEAGELDLPDVVWAADALTATRPPIAFPAGLEPQVQPLPPGADEQTPLPKADVVVITWTVDELAALAQVLTPEGQPDDVVQRYARSFDELRDRRSGRPLRRRSPSGSAATMPTPIGSQKVLCMKSELHLNQDGVKTGEGTATLPVKDFFKQIIAEAEPSLVLTVGTAGCGLRRLRAWATWSSPGPPGSGCQNEFRNEPFNGQMLPSDWAVPADRSTTPSA